MVKNQYRHGDVLLSPVATLPKGATELENFNGVLAYGESSGHKHEIVGDRVRYYRANDRLYILVEGENVALVHSGGIAPDHDPHHLAPRLYEFDPKREATLDEAGWRRVVD